MKEKYLNCKSLEDYQPNQPPEIWRRVLIIKEYSTDGEPRISVEILEGPECGRVVSGLSLNNLQDAPISDYVRYLMGDVLK